MQFPGSEANIILIEKNRTIKENIFYVKKIREERQVDREEHEMRHINGDFLDKEEKGEIGSWQ